MGTISADKISGALSKAQRIGIEEEEFVVAGTALTLRSLRPDEYAAVIAECDGLGDVDYLTAYQVGHIIRSIVEVNGVDLRDVDFVEVQESTPAGEVKNVKLERHDYLRKNLVDSWGKEVVFVVYQKFGDVVKTAEENAQKGVEFRVQDETPEQKYRRIMGDLKEIEDEVPEELLKSILEDAGFMRMSTAQELKAAMDRTDELAREQAAKDAEATAAAEPVVTPVKTDAEVAAEVDASNAEIMAKRQPMNVAGGQLPPDPHQTLQEAVSARQAPPDPAAQAQAQTGSQPAQADSAARKRAEKIAALEGDAGVPLEEGQIPPQPSEIPVLTGSSQGQVDPKGIAVDQPPSAGINPRWNPPKQA